LVEVTSSSSLVSLLLSFLLPLLLTSHRGLAVDLRTTLRMMRRSHSSQKTRPLAGEEGKNFLPRGPAEPRVK
jgi:hypothetical protein